MNTYHITEDETVFKNFVILNHFDESSFCFMTKVKGNEIYIRYIDDRIGEIIGIKYTLIPCDAPDIFPHDGWTYTGNPDLFNI